MTDDATQQTERATEPVDCDVHGIVGWSFGGLERMLVSARERFRFAGKIVVCRDCLDRMTGEERKFFDECVESYVKPTGETVPLDLEVVTDCSDPAEWCALHGLSDREAGRHVVELSTGESSSICGHCMDRVGHIRVRVTDSNLGRIHLNAESFKLIEPKEQP